jgi:hypothetical protein
MLSHTPPRSAKVKLRWQPRQFVVIAGGSWSSFIQSPLWITTACAQSPASTVKDFGLFDTWAYDCATPPSPVNPYAIFSLTSSGNVELRTDFGPDEMVYRIVDPQRLSHFRLSLTKSR